MRAAAELGIRTVAIYPDDDASSLHTRRADEALRIPGRGVAAYLDAEGIVDAARTSGCDAIHPGYGFLSENPAFARRCAQSGLGFVGPRPESLELFGDKARARGLAERSGVPILPGTSAPTTIEEAHEFMSSREDAIVIKAIAGGGGRGMRIVRNPDELIAAFERCRSEASAAFGRGELYVERLLPRARHVEVQIVGDGTEITHLWERECSLQRRYQKLIEIAPAPGLDPELRRQIIEAAVRLAEADRFLSLGTFEFLIDPDGGYSFIEANPRLQVEHTVTEEITGIDLVQTQLQIASGRSLADLGLRQSDVPTPRGFAIQARINLETVRSDGTLEPSGGTITAFEPPSGPGIRTDSSGYAGYTTSPSFDPLLAKVIAHSPSGEFRDALNRVTRGLREFRIEGVQTNLPFLQRLLRHPDVEHLNLHTRLVEDLAGSLATEPETGFAGARLDTTDPLAILDHGKSEGGVSAPPTGPQSVPVAATGPEHTVPLLAPLQGTIVSIDVENGAEVRAGQSLLVMEAMKMEHVVTAETSGIVRKIAVSPGDTVYKGHPLLFLEPADVEAVHEETVEEIDLDRVRPDLAEVHERHARGEDDRRPDAVARRRKTGQRTARENVEDLCDPDSYLEYGPVVIAAQRRRRSVEDLIARTPADGMLAGVGRINGDLFGEQRSRCVVMAYDYTVLAGTQGLQNHRKKDRMFELAEQWKLPLVFFTEGGGGRPGDTDGVGVAGLDCMAFHYFGRLSGLVPLVGINSGRCFAGNAALLGCCDVVIATADSTIGMGGPAMIEGGGLGIFRPEEVGPMAIQVPNGVVDLPVEDEAEAVQVAKKYLSYFQGSLPEWECADPRLLRGIIPENRLRIYDVRQVIETLADTGSVLELRRAFGPGMVTALVRIEGRPIGVIANNPTHLAGAIDSEGADKASRFMQLCDAFDLPILFLCDTPGIMVGPEAEKTALVRHASRMFVTGASLTVPFFTIVLRKGYGLGAQAMAGGSFKAPIFTVSWPTGEFGGMGLEGAVKLGYRKELAAQEDPEERRVLYEQMVERMYQHGKAVNTASHFEIDDVIDPMDSRRWIGNALRSVPDPPPRSGKKRPCIDTW